MAEEKILLNVAETADYLNLGKTQVRALMKSCRRVWVIQLGNRSYAHRELLNKWLLAQVHSGTSCKTLNH